MQKHNLLFVLIFFTVVINLNAQIFEYDFTNGNQEWTGDFADYPINDSLAYELNFSRATLPEPLDQNKYALMITGNNHSDDLFMFIKRKITGLTPNTTYKLLIDVELASKAQTNSFGIGGAPGESVIIKAGASITEPGKTVVGAYYRMNINKGDQTEPGTDVDTIGNVGVTDTTTVFTMINRNNSNNIFTITTDSNGEVWVCIGTDSGFEGTTTLYYSRINFTFTSTTGIDDDKNIPGEYSLSQNYPNPFNPTTTIEYVIPNVETRYSAGGGASPRHVTLKVYDLLGREVLTLVDGYKEAGKHSVEFRAQLARQGGNAELPSGIYFYRMQVGSFNETKKFILMK